MGDKDDNGDWEDQTVKQTVAYFGRRGCGSVFVLIPLAAILTLVAQWIRASAF